MSENYQEIVKHIAIVETFWTYLIAQAWKEALEQRGINVEATKLFDDVSHTRENWKEIEGGMRHE